MNDLLFDIEGLSDEVNLITKFGQFSSETEKYSKINSDLENNKIDQILRCWRLSAKILEWYKSQIEAKKKADEVQKSNIPVEEVKTVSENVEDNKEINDTNENKLEKKNSINLKATDLSATKDRIIKLLIDKANILHKINVPKSWTIEQQNLKLCKELSKDSIKGKTTSSKSKLDELQHLILAYFKAEFVAKDVLNKIEDVQIRALRRTADLKIIGDIVNVKMLSEAVIISINWFCSVLRKGTNFLAHCTDNCEGCSYDVREKLQNTFFKCLRDCLLNEVMN